MRKGIFAVVAVLMWTTAAVAHHPFADQFDTSKSVTLSGTVTKVEWNNPHVYTYIDVKDAQGKMVNWKVEMGSPAQLAKEGWSRTSVKTGDMVTVKGWAAKNTANLANAESFTLPGGKTLTAVSSFHMGQTQQGQLARDTSQEGQPTGTTGTEAQQPRDPQAQQRDQQAEPVDTQARSEQEALPGTASPLGLFAALGALSLAGAFGLRAFRR